MWKVPNIISGIGQFTIPTCTVIHLRIIEDLFEWCLCMFSRIKTCFNSGFYLNSTVISYCNWKVVGYCNHRLAAIILLLLPAQYHHIHDSSQLVEIPPTNACWIMCSCCSYGPQQTRGIKAIKDPLENLKNEDHHPLLAARAKRTTTESELIPKPTKQLSCTLWEDYYILARRLTWPFGAKSW